jgi:hypothetical protein
MQRQSIAKTLGDYLADSWKAPLALGFALAFLTMYLIGEFFPDLTKKVDVGILMLTCLAVPMIGATLAWWIWAKSWRRRRAAPEASLAPAPPPRTRFGGLPEPGGSLRDPQGLPAAALAALDRDDPIAAIKVLRAELGLGLAEAKTRVDAELSRRRGK